MGRKVMPARVFKRSYADGTALYAWRPRPGADEISGKGPGSYGPAGEAQLNLFRAHVLLCWHAGIEPTPPGTFLTSTKPATEIVIVPSGSTTATLRTWIGNPAKGKRGRFFLFAKPMSSENAKGYESMFRNHGAFDLIGNIPLDQVTVDDAMAVCNRVLKCETCAERASRLVPTREIAAFDLRVDQLTFDKVQCPSHHPSRLKQRTSVERYVAKINAAFNAAIRAKIITENPFATISYGHWDEPETNDDLRVRLTHFQMDVLTRAHPEKLKVVPVVSTEGMLRRSEMWGLWAIDFPVPPADPTDDPEHVAFQLARVWNTAAKQFVPWGKTAASLSEPITLGAAAVKVLNDHLRNHMPTSLTCSACQSGERMWRGVRRGNPHRGCGYANNAPLVPYSLCTPDHYSKVICPDSQKAAGLGDIGFAITHRSYRSTGAVHHLDAGILPTTVVKMGRWKNLDTLMKHYNRPTHDQFAEAARLVDRMRAAELGLDQSDAAPVGGRLRFLSDQNAGLSERCQALELENAQLREGQAITPRSQASPIIQAPISKRPVGKWDAISDDDLRAAIASEHSRSRVLAALGLSSAEKNYARLRTEALRLAVELPDLWATTRDAEAS
jgi:hypothetical protein